jgi:hypothetical protein
MIATKDFVLLHNFRSGGTFLNSFIIKHLGGQELAYHAPYTEIPDKYRDIPVIGTVRNPWDWYISVYYHYLNFGGTKSNTLVNLILGGNSYSLEESISRIIDTSWMTTKDISKALSKVPEHRIEDPNARGDNITKAELYHYISNFEEGMYSWYLYHMFRKLDNVYICKTETLGKDFYTLLQNLKIPIKDRATIELLEGERLNELRDTNMYIGKVHYPRTEYKGYYTQELRDMVYEKDKEAIASLEYVY